MSGVLFNIAERVDSSRGYFKHEAASTTSRLTNGKPLDSGAAMRMASNLAHLCYESPRHLVQSPGLGASKIEAFASASTLFNNVTDNGYLNSDTSVGAIDGASALPWDPRVCEFFPAILIADRQIGHEASPSATAIANEGRTTIRSVRFSMDFDADATNSSQSVGFAITTHDSPERLRQGDYLAFWGSGLLSTGPQIVTQTLSCDRPIAPHDYIEIPSRTTGETMTRAIVVNLWFGWKFIGTGVANAVNGLCAWESRIDTA